MKEDRFWQIADDVKRKLFARLRKQTSQINYLNYKIYREKFENIPSSLLEEWEKMREKYKDEIDVNDANRLKGFLYEALFYYACLQTQTVFLDAEILIFEGVEFGKYPPWFECIPLYDIIPNLHYIWEGGEKKRKVPQIKADFLVIYTDDKGPSPPALIDVKSSKPYAAESWRWAIVASLRCGFIFQFAYPKTEFPNSLKEWEIKTPCPECRGLSDDSHRCSECEAEIFPFDITTPYYLLKKHLKPSQ
jgi:hypothetical protein